MNMAQTDMIMSEINDVKSECVNIGGGISSIEELLAPNRYYTPEMVADPGVRSAAYKLTGDDGQHFFFESTPPDVDSESIVWKTVADVTGPALLHSLSMTTNYYGADRQRNPAIKIYWRLTLDDEVYVYRFGSTSSSSQDHSNVSISTNNAISNVSTSGLKSAGYLDNSEDLSLKLSNAVLADHIKYEVSLGRLTGFETAVTTQIDTTLKYQLIY